MFIESEPTESGSSSVRSGIGLRTIPSSAHATPMPLLTELERDLVGSPFYKHGAPNGAFARDEAR
jgi:hypothetical protein